MSPILIDYVKSQHEKLKMLYLKETLLYILRMAWRSKDKWVQYQLIKIGHKAQVLEMKSKNKASYHKKCMI